MLKGRAEHLADGISERMARECGQMFDSGNVTQIDETTFGVRLEGREYRGDGIVYNTAEDGRDFNQLRWQENDGEDFVLPED